MLWALNHPRRIAVAILTTGLGALAGAWLDAPHGWLWGLLAGTLIAPLVPVPDPGCGLRRPPSGGDA